MRGIPLIGCCRNYQAVATQSRMDDKAHKKTEVSDVEAHLSVGGIGDGFGFVRRCRFQSQ